MTEAIYVSGGEIKNLLHLARESMQTWLPKFYFLLND